MFQDQCISVTDLRTKTKECLENLSKEPKYIFINNRPIAVLLDIRAYDVSQTKPSLKELEMGEVTTQLKQQARRAKKSTKTDLMNI